MINTEIIRKKVLNVFYNSQQPTDYGITEKRGIIEVYSRIFFFRMTGFKLL